MRLSPVTATLILLLGCDHQVMGAMYPRSSDSAFDANKGVFSSQGRLLQLDFVEVGMVPWYRKDAAGVEGGWLGGRTKGFVVTLELPNALPLPACTL